MSSASIRFTTFFLFFFLGSLQVLQSFSYLILETASGSDTLTCISDDDDAAFIWNHDLIGNIESTSFYPKKSLTENIAKCAVSNSTGCFIRWKNISEWNPVNSAVEPMGPVLDYRWEGFEEIVFPKDGYQNVHDMNSRSGSVVFSVRASQNVHLIMCEKKDRPIGQCLWIIIGVLNFEDSAIRSCVERPQESRKFPHNFNCSSLIREKLPRGKIVYPYEWRTFRIRWDDDPKVIQVFNHTESKPFMEGSLERWNPTSPTLHMMTKIEGAARIRFHLYDYWRTRNENVSISTAQFNTDDVIFHVHLLVGLCQECKMKIDLVDINGRSITNTISVSKGSKSAASDLLNWRSVILKWNLQDVDRNNLKLEIQTILTVKRATGRWAIGNIRLSKSVDGVRKSTIKSSPSVKCQKISYSASAIVDRNNSRIISNNNDPNEGIGFVSNKKLQADGSGNPITLTIPAVVNARDNTVRVVIKGSLICSSSSAPNSSLLKNDREILVAEYEAGEEAAKNLIISINQSVDQNLNCSLIFGEEYGIGVNVEFTIHGTNVSTNIASDWIILGKPQLQTTQLVWIVIPVILGICMTYLYTRYRWKISRGRRIEDDRDNVSLSAMTQSTDTFVDRSTFKRTKSVLDAIEKRVSSHVYANPYEVDSRSVSVDYFEEYAKQASDNGVLISQFMVFPRGLKRPCSYGKLAENLPKNRDSDLIPYDDTRVVLEKLSDDPFSDYINASYIPGYCKEKAYIATQAPLPNTVNDFWRMIWHEKVNVICMLTNITEGSKIKCERYWPLIGEKKSYGKIRVLNMGHEVFPDYIIRTWKISHQNWKRRVTHLHYTRWPHYGVPMQFQSLVPYLKKLDESMSGNGPVVVHCSTGSGRTGTIILCDICLRQGSADKTIDVLAQATKLRHNRADMIDTPQQYLLAHIIIAESIQSLPTRVPCINDLPRMVKKLKRRLPEHIERLNEALWQERALFSLIPPQCPTPGDFRTHRLPKLHSVYPDVVFFERSSTTENNGKKDYISAVSVDGVRVRKQYLASQLPSNSTRSKFWRLIADRNVQLVIILQNPDPHDSSSCGLMPTGSNVISVPYVQIEIESRIHDQEHFTIDRLQLTNTSEEEERSQPVTVLTCTGWGSGKSGTPPAPGALVEIWRASENIQRKKGPTLLLCHDGITGCGLYLAMSFLLERMAVERECDVISAVRAVRRFRPEFVQELEQFRYLYDAAVYYVECFETYSNFS